MKNKISNKLLQCLSLVLLAGIWGGCTDEREVYEAPGGGGTAQREVTFSVQVPGAGTPDTYALSPTNENEVTQIAVLLFGAGGYTHQPLWCNTITSSGTNGNTKEFTVKIPEGTYSMMVLANANQSLSAALTAATDPIAVGDSKATVAAKVLQAISGTAKWIANSSDPAYKAIPMWGEIPTTTVNSSMVLPINISLVRMLAKINVTLTTAAAKTSFKLKNVRLYNYNDRGQVAPNTSTWTGTPSVPASAQKPAVPVNSPLIYTAMTTADVACTNEIYTFESNRGTSATHLNNTCLVIGGRYTGDTADSYYRIDFANTSGSTTTYLHLLRNHSYEVNITGVSSPGLPTPEDAFKSRAVKIQADILAWNDGAMSDVVSDGQHKLQVSQGAFTFTREARTAASPDNTLSITTDVSSGWKVLKIIDASNTDINIDTNPSTGWIRLSPNNKNNAGSLDTRILLKENTSGSSRTAKIHINAGRLTYVVTVTQTTATALMLTLRDAATNTIDVTDLVFASAAGVTPAQQSVRLSWMPIDRAVSVSTAAFGGNAFVYNTGGSLHTPGEGTQTSYPGGTGSLTLNIQPTGSNPLESRISKVDFTVFNGSNYLSKSLFLRQVAPPGLIVDNVQSLYSVNGSSHTLYVRSNATWKIQSVTQSRSGLLNLSASDNLKTSTTGGVDTGTGTPVTFTVANTNLNIGGTVTVVFASTDPQKYFSNVTVVLNFKDDQYWPTPHTGWAGSNIYWDGSKLTFDDVSASPPHQNYQGVFFQWGSLWGIAPNGSNGSAWSTTHTVYKTSGGTYSEVQNVAWTAIPHIPDTTGVYSYPPSGKSERDRAYLYELSDEANGRGDICKFLTKMGYAPGSPATKWRMPTSNEFEGTYSSSGTWNVVTSNSPSGAYDNPWRPGLTKAAAPEGTYPPAFFPGAGYRNSHDGSLGSAGSISPYWATSPATASSGAAMTFGKNILTVSQYSRPFGFPVRCAKE